MGNVEKCRELGILDDLLENHSEEAISNMDASEILDAWLNWEGIIDFTSNIIKIYETFREDPDVAEYELCREEFNDTESPNVPEELLDFDLSERGVFKVQNSFRDLSREEEKQFRQWARDNYEPNTKISTLWHPVVQDECNTINKETNQINEGEYERN